MKKLLSLFLAACLLICVMPPIQTEAANDLVVLDYDASKIASIGSQDKGPYDGMCMAYSYAYCKTIMTGEKANPTNYWGSKGGTPGDTGFTDYTFINNQDYLKAVYNEINSGRPVVMNASAGNEFRTGATAASPSHWFVAIGYKKSARETSLKASDFYILDPKDAKCYYLSDNWQPEHSYGLRMSRSGVVVKTRGVTEITDKTANINGTINAGANNKTSEFGFYLGSSLSDARKCSEKLAYGKCDVNYYLGDVAGHNKWVDNLSPGTRYIYVFYAIVNGIEFRSGIHSFTTGTSTSNVSVTGISLNKTTASMNTGSSETLTATVSPSNATNKTVSWSSGNNSIATVSNGKITAVGVGSTTITAKTADGGKTATCKVTVSQTAQSSNSLANIRLYGQRSANHCAEASLACVQAYRLGLTMDENSDKGKAMYWTCWAYVTGGAIMPTDGFTSVTRSAASICSQIDAGNPALCYFNSWNGGSAHWVVAYGYDGNNIKVMCPAHNNNTPAASWVTKAKSEFNSSTLKYVYILNTNFVQNIVSGTEVIADGVFKNVKTASKSGDEANISFSMRSEGSAGHDLYDLGFILASDKNMSKNVVKHYESEKYSRNSSGVFGDVQGSSYGMKKWCGGINSSATYWYQFFIVKNGIEIKTLPRKLGTDEINTSYTGGGSTTISPTGVSLNKSSTTINKGGSETLTATVSPSNATNKSVTWSSDNTSVATVDKNGKVTAVGGGTANITVKTADGGKTASCKVTVNVPVTGIKLNKSSTTIEKGKTETLTATVSPSDASNKNVSWSSDNTDVATVNSSGKVTAKADGSANITVKTADGGKTASCKVTVKTTPLGVSLNKSATTIDVGKTETLKATVKPDDATNKKVTWSSDNEAVATVDSNGKVTAVKKGTANITVTTNDGGKQASCKVTVNVPVTDVTINTPDTTSIKKGTTLKLSATVSPSDASNTKVTWSSGDESVATVDANGKVTGVAPGTATITVTTNDGLKTDSIDIEVYWYGNINIDYLWDGQENAAIELDANGRVVSAPITPDRIGYILEGWYKEKTFASKVDFAKDVLAKDSTVYAKWAPITYTVKYDPNCNGSGKMMDLKCSYDQKYALAANSFANPHNIFIGWNTQADGKGKAFDNKASIENLTTKDGDVITLYAQWESTYCTVTFDYLDGVHSAVTQKVDKGGLVIAPEVFERADYVFDGWYSDSSFKTPFNPATGTIEGDTTLYAHWIPSSDDYGDLSEEEIEEIIEGGKTGDDIPNNLWISGVTDKQYTGKEITQSFKAYDHKTLLKSGKDYTVKYTNNKKVGTATITIKGKGNYSGTVTETFQILPADISETTNSVVFDKTMFKAYTGGVQNPVPSLTVNGKKLTNKKDYIVTYPSSGEDAYVAPGLYVVRLTGTGNYTGYVDIAMTIGDQGRVSVSKLTIGSISAQTYTGSELTPAVSVKNGKKKLTENVDYEVSYSNNINVGTATVKITGKGNFFGEKTATFKIKGTAIADAVRVSLSQSTFTYDKSEHIPGVTVTAKKTGATLIKGVDYEVSYSNTVNAGKATVTITGKGSYSGTVKKTYTIAAYNISSDPDSLMTLKVTDNVTMMKGGAKPGVKLTYDGKDLVEGKDYKLTYSNNTSVGGKNKPAVTIKGCGNFAGTITKNYVIEQQSIYSLSISVKDVQYSPKAGKYKSVPTITDLNGKALKSGTDYNNVKYTYENETILPDGTTRLAGDTVGSKDILPVGTVVRVSATGKGNYAGTISTTYRIVKCSIANAKITVKNQEYTGKAVIPGKEDIVVKVNGVTLSSDEFEIISCSNNVNKGSKAKVTIRGLNAYGGVKSQTFTIKSKAFKWWWE